MMRILIRTFLLFILLFVSLLYALPFLLQTTYLQEKIAQWVEKGSGAQLTVGTVKASFPFKFSIENLQYKTPVLEASFEKIEATFLPALLLFGRLAIADLKIERAHLLNQEKKWPHFAFPIDLYHLKIDSLTTNECRDLALRGDGSLNSNFNLNLHLSDPLRPHLGLHLRIDGEDKKQVLHCFAHLTHQAQAMHLSAQGIYDWSTQSFEADLHGEGKGWKGKAKGLVSKQASLSLSHFQVHVLGFDIQGLIDYDFQTRFLKGSGTFLNRPFLFLSHLSMNGEEIVLSPFNLDYDREILCGHLSYLPHEKTFIGELDFVFNDLKMAFHSFEDLKKTALKFKPLEGYANGHLSFDKGTLLFNMQAKEMALKELYIPQINIEGSYDSDCLSCAIDLPDFTIYDSAYEVFPKVQLQLHSQLHKEMLTTQGYVWGLGEQPFYLMSQLPLHYSPFLQEIKINPLEPFLIHLQGCGSIDPILAFLENASLIAHGNVDLNLTATGTWDEPYLQGHLIFDEGNIESLTTGAVFKNIHMEMEGVGKELEIRSLFARDLQKGELTGHGQLTWDPANHFPFNFHINTDHYMILALDPFTATVNAQILLAGTAKAMTVTGQARLIEGHLSIPTKIPVQIPTVEVSYINPIVGDLAECLAHKSFIPVHWDIGIEAPNHLFIEGRGLESEWKGSLKITGEQHALDFRGKLHLVQGRLKIINRMFGLVEGEVRIEGLKPKDLFVNLRGDYELPNLTASVLITGGLDGTSIGFCSNPPMNMNQILSWILFQQDINELTPMQACSLASMLVSMSGKYTGPKTFDNIKEGLGIDVFSITDCDIDSADLTFQVGKYLSQGTFVGINKSISGNFDSVLIQTRLIRNFYLEADYGGSLNGVTPSAGKVILKWYKSY